MFIDYALMILGGLVLLAYAVANVLVVINYSIRFMWQEFWVEQKWFGKICANVFYAPAWVISVALTIFTFVIGFLVIVLFKVFKKLSHWIYPLFEKAKTLNL